MKLCIIEAGLTPEPLQPAFGRYAAMIEDWIAPYLPEARFSVITVVNDEPLPDDPQIFDGYLISGSRYGVYDELPWMQDLQAFLRAAGEAQTPLFGMCFGHQIMAAAFGGQVIKAETGWNVGAQPYCYPGIDDVPNSPAFVFHQDQVVEKPPGARVVGHSNRCAIGALAYDAMPAFSVQPHPEFDSAYVRALLDLCSRDETVPKDRSDRGYQSLVDYTVDSTPTAQRVAALFRK